MKLEKEQELEQDILQQKIKKSRIIPCRLCGKETKGFAGFCEDCNHLEKERICANAIFESFSCTKEGISDQNPAKKGQWWCI